jgi:hypothetical protein
MQTHHQSAGTEKVEKIDWRKTNAAGLPTGARRPDEPVPEGAWGTATSASTVSREALEEADVLPDRYSQPLTVQQKIMRGLLIGAGVVAFLIVLGVGIGWWLSSRETQTVKSVQDYANSEAATEKIGREGVAALHVALGEYHLRTRRPECAKEAKKEFAKAIEILTPQDGAAAKDSERDAILGDLALLQTDLGGTKDEIDKTTRLNWNETQGEVGKTLRAMHHPEARLDAYRGVCRRLIARKETKRALLLAAQLSDDRAEQAEALGIAGLEMLAAKEQAFADQAANEALGFYTQENERPLLTPSVVALAVVLNRDPRPRPDPDNETERLNDLIGHVEGLARNGDVNKARERAENIEENNPIARLRAFTALAAAGEAKSDNPDLLEAIKLASGPLQHKESVGWLQLRVAALAARAGVGDAPLNNLANAIRDPDLAGRARLLALREKLAAKNAGPQAPLPADPPTLSHYLSVEMLARYNRSFNAAKADDADRAFGVIGSMIGAPSK